MRDGDELRIDLPQPVRAVLAGLAEAGAEAVLVGGCVRDLVRGDRPADWDIGTSAPPEAVVERFPGATWQNRFGTVTIRPDDAGPPIEVTTYRVEDGYRDRRRPDRVAWTGSLSDDLSRRDFTINAMAWLPVDLESGRGRLVDPFNGSADLAAGILRAVGAPDERFAEDALRLVRAPRFAARFELGLDPATEDAIRANAPAAADLSGERVRDELLRILAAPIPPSRALRAMEALGLLAVVLPELAALRGVPQGKALPGDALDHSLRAADALPAGDPILRLAGLLHDVGKASTLADGHFIGHELVGADLAAAVASRLRLSGPDADRVVRLVRHHMFAYTPEWTDAAIRRFVRRVGPDLLDDLFALRRADDAASGTREPASGGLEELRSRVRRALAEDPLSRRQLAVNGDDLVAELGMRPGPRVGKLLAELMESVLEDPSRNRREVLLDQARERLGDGAARRSDGARAHREPGPPASEGR